MSEMDNYDKENQSLLMSRILKEAEEDDYCEEKVDEPIPELSEDQPLNTGKAPVHSSQGVDSGIGSASSDLVSLTTGGQSVVHDTTNTDSLNDYLKSLKEQTAEYSRRSVERDMALQGLLALPNLETEQVNFQDPSAADAAPPPPPPSPPVQVQDVGPIPFEDLVSSEQEQGQ